MNRSPQSQYDAEQSPYPRFGNPIANTRDNYPNGRWLQQGKIPPQNSYAHQEQEHKVTLECDYSFCCKTCGSCCTCCNVNWETPRKMFAEFLGTLMLIYIGCKGCNAFSFGFGLVLSAQTVGHISGGHFNPAVSIAALIMGEIGFLKFPLYLLSQFLGGFVGYALHSMNEFDAINKECGTNISVVTPEEGLVIEVLATAFLALACCSFWDKNNGNNDGTGSIKAGLLLTGLIIATAPFTGASFNTARSLPPSLYSNDWENHWVYWVGPNVGGAAGGVIYRFLLLKSD